MTTRLTTHISGPNEHGVSWQIDVVEDWDTIFNRVFPITPPASSLEHRENMWYTKVDGGRIAIVPGNIYCFEEVDSADTDS